MSAEEADRERDAGEKQKGRCEQNRVGSAAGAAIDAHHEVNSASQFRPRDQACGMGMNVAAAVLFKTRLAAQIFPGRRRR
jgi:hypothetical protein